MNTGAAVITHYRNDSTTTEWLLMSADLRHEASGVSLEFRNGRWIVDGVVQVDSIVNATELLSEVA